MKLSPKSWHAKLYDLTYISERPTNLCPYFWKLVLACILFPYLGVWFLPMFIIGWFKGETILEDAMLSPDFVIALTINLALFAAFCMVGMWFWPLGGEWLWVQKVGAACWFISVIVVICWRIDVWKKKIREKRYLAGKGARDEKVNLLSEFVKAKYNKYCPKIEWDEPTQP